MMMMMCVYTAYIGKACDLLVRLGGETSLCVLSMYGAALILRAAFCDDQTLHAALKRETEPSFLGTQA